MPIDVPAPLNHYIIDAENGTEMARLIVQDQLFTQAMGGLFPEYAQEELPEHIGTILDIGCGPAGWTLAVAHRYADIQVIGIDISESMVRYAQTRAASEGLDNATFLVMDATKPLDLPDATFDLINMRFAVGFLTPTTWPALLRECRRISHPGGTIRLTECEIGFTTSSALQQLNRLVCQAFFKTGRSFSPDGLTLGIVPMLKPLLMEAGLINIHLKPSLLESSVDTPLYYPSRDDAMIVYPLLKPFLVEVAQVVDAGEFEALYQQVMIQMYADEFAALTLAVTARGSIPAEHTLAQASIQHTQISVSEPTRELVTEL